MTEAMSLLRAGDKSNLAYARLSVAPNAYTYIYDTIASLTDELMRFPTVLRRYGDYPLSNVNI